MTKNFVSLNTNTSSRQVTAAMIFSPSPGVRSMKFRPRGPRVPGTPGSPSVSQISGWPAFEKCTRLGVDSVPPGPALAVTPYAVATSRFDAFVPLVDPGVLAVTQTAPARGSAWLGLPLTFARTAPSAHPAPSKRRSGSAPLAAYRYSLSGSPKRAKLNGRPGVDPANVDTGCPTESSAASCPSSSPATRYFRPAAL